MHANLGLVSLTSLKLSTTHINFHPIIALAFSSPEFRNIIRLLSLLLQHSLDHFFFNLHQNNHITMIFKNNPQATKDNSASEPLKTSSSIPKMVEPITTVSSYKSKNKTATKSASKKKKSSKSKRGKPKTSLSMADLYEKENHFVSTVVEPNAKPSKKDPKT